MQLMDKTGLISDRIPLVSEAGPKENNPTAVPELGFQQVIGIFRRRRKLILTVASVGTMLAGITGLLITPKYTATAQVIQVQGTTPYSPEALQQAVDTQVTMLTSPYYLRRVLDSMRDDPAFRELKLDHEADSTAKPNSVQPDITDAGPLGLTELKRRVGVWLGSPTWHRHAGAGLKFDDFQRRLQVLQERRSRVINVTFQWTNPKTAAAIVNRIVELYVRSNAEQQRAYTTGELARLDQRIGAVKDDIDRTSTALHNAIERRTSAFRSAGSEKHEADVDPRELDRQTAASAQLYASLLQRQREIREQEELVNPDVSVLSLASPPSRPSSPNPLLFMLPALIVSAMCGCFIALAQERLDRSLRNDKDLTDALGVDCIGLVPTIPQDHLTDSKNYVRLAPFSPYADALRSTIAMLRLVEPGHPKVVLISSSISGEGRTTLAQGLATHISLLGRRALLIGIDARSSMPIGEFKEAGKRRIVDLQNRSLAESIRHIPEIGFDCLQISGYRLDAMNATEQIAGVIRQLRERYDCMIIDGPPVLTAVEARLFPSLVDKLLFVVKWGDTRREVVQNAMSLLRNCGCFENERDDFTAAILTQVDLKKHAQYRYGDVSEFAADAMDPPKVSVRQSCLAALTFVLRWMQEIWFQALEAARSFRRKGFER